MNDVITPVNTDRMRDMYVNKRIPVKEIAKEFGVPYPEILKVIRDNNWLQEVEQNTALLRQEASEKYQEYISRERLPAAVRHGHAGAHLVEHIDRKLREIEENRDFATARDLSNLAKALKDASDVEARAKALSDNPFPTMLGGNDIGHSTPLILVGVQPRPIAPAPPTAIDVTSEVILEPSPMAEEEEDPF